MHQGKRKLTGLLTIGLLLALGFSALAAEYPTKRITLVIPFMAGAGTDLTGRALATAAKKYLGQPIICENIAGGGGTVGPTLVVKKPADGYTIGITASNTVNINWHMREMDFHPLDDVTHIIRVSGILNAIVVRADSQWKTIQEFIQYSKQNPQKISYGSSGVGTPPHLAMEELASLAGGIQWIHVPYKGAADSSTALLGGHVEAISGSSGGWAHLVDAGKFRVLATYAPLRSARYTQVRPLKEIGYALAYSSPLDIMGPKGMPKAVVKKLHDAFKMVIDEPEFQAVLKKIDMFPIYLNSEDLEKASQQEFDHMGQVVQKLGLQKK